MLVNRDSRPMRCLIIALAALCLAAPWARAAGSKDVTLNFVNADIDGVVKAISQMTGKNFVLDPRVKGTVNIISAKPVPTAMAYRIFLSALRLQGFAAVPDGDIVDILPVGDAKLHQGPTFGPRDKIQGAGHRIVTQVFDLKYENAAALVPILRPLIAPNNSITAYPNGKTLVVTDYASNLARIERIIAAIDQPSGSEPVVIPLKYASALDVAQQVNRLFAKTGHARGTADQLTVVADARSNSLLARAPGDPEEIAQLRRFVALLDTPTSAAGNIHVIRLKNADAVELAKTLRAIYSGNRAPETSAHASMISTAPLNASADRTAASPFAAQAQPLPTGQDQTDASAPGIIQADAATNSLIITAPDPVYNSLRAAVQKLDKRRAQVYVEALIAEVTSDKAAEFGIQWQNLKGIGQNHATVFGGTNFGTGGQNILGLSQNPTAAAPGLNIGILNGSVTAGGVNIMNLGVLVRALETDSHANILSTPTLLTLNNDTAKIVVGQNVPFITGQYAVSGAATTPTPFQTVERKDVGLTLKIKPQISAGNTIKLKIYQEVSSIADTTNSAGVITNLRSVQSTVLVDSGQIVVLGGLMQDSVNNGVSKVPLLGDLPVVGNLFKYNTQSHSKTNLMVFLRPVIVRSAKRADALSRSSYDYMLGVQEQAAAEGETMPLLPEGGSPQLPPEAPAQPSQ